MKQQDLMFTQEEYEEARNRAFEKGYQAGHLKGQEAGLKLAMEVMDRSTQAIIMDRMPFTNDKGEL